MIPSDFRHGAGLHGNHIRDFSPGGDLGHPAEHQFGTASSRGWTCTIDDNPIGFCLIVCGKAVCLGFSITMIFYAFGLAGDPVAHIKHALPFLS
jgi:hypothetical protein